MTNGSGVAAKPRVASYPSSTQHLRSGSLRGSSFSTLLESKIWAKYSENSGMGREKTSTGGMYIVQLLNCYCFPPSTRMPRMPVSSTVVKAICQNDRIDCGSFTRYSTSCCFHIRLSQSSKSRSVRIFSKWHYRKLHRNINSSSSQMQLIVWYRNRSLLLAVKIPDCCSYK